MRRRSRFLNSLSGRFLLLTMVFVMLAEIMIFVPSVARFREDYLLARIERAQIASLALLASDELISEDLEEELLENAGVMNVVLRRDETRRLILSSPMPSEIHASFDLRDPGPFELIGDALKRITDSQDRSIRVIGSPTQEAGSLIEVTMETATLRAAMIDYGLRILALSAMISVVTALLLFLAVRGFLVSPIKRVVQHMKSYASAPEDARRIIEPQAGVQELFEAETALQSMQTELTSALRQKERLALLGGAVAKISHDLRNILTTATLFADRMEMSNDPGVQRAAPKLVNSLSRAVSLCESTLAFGKAEEPAPTLSRLPLAPVVQDAIDSEELASADYDLTFQENVAPGLIVRADGEQLYRVLLNLMRNARQAVVASGKPGTITIAAKEDDAGWIIEVADDGPGLPAQAQEKLFQPFQGGARKGGTGLGLVIAAELVRGHGGSLSLSRTGPEGTTFTVLLPKSVFSVNDAAA